MAASSDFGEVLMRLGNMVKIVAISLYGKSQNRLVSFTATVMASGLSFHSRQFKPSNQPLMTDQQIIQAALDAGICFPDCWALRLGPQHWDDEERRRMDQLRHFSELIKAL